MLCLRGSALLPQILEPGRRRSACCRRPGRTAPGAPQNRSEEQRRRRAGTCYLSSSEPQAAHLSVDERVWGSERRSWRRLLGPSVCVHGIRVTRKGFSSWRCSRGEGEKKPSKKTRAHGCSWEGGGGPGTGTKRNRGLV